MRFRNVKVPEGINVSRHSPVLDLFLLTGGLLLALAIVMVVLIWLGGSLGRYLPVSWENRLADRFMAAALPGGEKHADVTAALQGLADRLAAPMDADPETRIVVHYIDDEAVNAYATLGGHVFVTRGLIARLTSENALAMVMAHEIAHVIHRDVIAAISGGLLLQIVTTAILGQSSEQVSGMVAGSGTLLSRGFSREAERDADAAALRALAATYGHVAGAGDLFAVLKHAVAEAGGGEPPEFMSTHPLTDDRIAAIRATAQAEGWPVDGVLTDLPAPLAALEPAGE